jgi:hypothetical protein
MAENSPRDPGSADPSAAPPRTTSLGIPLAPRPASVTLPLAAHAPPQSQPPAQPMTQPPSAPAAPGSPAAAGTGFAAQFDGTSLWDLIQFECLRRSDRIVRIISRGQVGFLYFRAGNIVHATTLRGAGEPAVREMLEWTGGVIEPWQGRWPERESINVPWQSLLLVAAQAADRAGGAGPRIYLPPAASAPEPAPARSAAEAETVVLSKTGQILKGHKVRGLPEAAAYAAQMADLIGEYLGLEGFQTLEASFETVHYLVARDRDGGMVARRSDDPAQLEPLKRELGL